MLYHVLTLQRLEIFGAISWIKNCLMYNQNNAIWSTMCFGKPTFPTDMVLNSKRIGQRQTSFSGKLTGKAMKLRAEGAGG